MINDYTITISIQLLTGNDKNTTKLKYQKYHSTRKIKTLAYEGITILLQSMNEQLFWLSFETYLFHMNRRNFLTMIR
jgi:hypothetical protein